ncbi:MAG: hypothetical protein M3277_07900 [Actinomycetota bacterium]|nr:hypothetical protein [Actinomycetota bacterium]
MIDRARNARWTAVAALAISISAAIAAVILGELNGGGGRASIPLLIATEIFVVVGALILSRRADNAIGWVFCAIGVFWTTGALAVEYAVFGTVTRPGTPLAWLGAWYGEWNWIPFWFLTLVVTPTLFPTGRPLSRRWRIFAAVAGTSAVVMTILISLDPVLDVEGTSRTFTNPIGIDGATWLDPDNQESLSSILLFPVMFISAAAAGVSIVMRFRRSRGDERLQLKWFAFAAVLMVAGFFALAFTSGQGSISFFYGTFVAFVPMSAGVAILRYRLYDIDVIINRTLVYGALTTALLVSYLVIVVTLSRVLDPVTRDSDVAVAGSTLAVAALFRPLRARIQGFIDRRFYRAKYDGVRALTAFGTRLRDQVDIDAVRGDVLTVVSSTVQPAHASVWIRAQEVRE